MKEIPRIDLTKAHVLTPAEMNKIHFASGAHTTLRPKT